MRSSYEQSEYTKPVAEYNPPPEQSATLSGGRRFADRFGLKSRHLAEVGETETQAPELQTGALPDDEQPEPEPGPAASADATQASERMAKRKRSLLLQFAAAASSVVLVTNSFGIDLLGVDGLFNDSVIMGELSTEHASGHYDDDPYAEPETQYSELIPFGGDQRFPRLSDEWTVTQDQSVDAHNRYIATAKFMEGSMGEQAMVDGFVWSDRKDAQFFTGPIPMSFPGTKVSAESSSLFYDENSNTLTLHDYHGEGLVINNMGQDFTIRLEGDNVLSEYLMVGGGSLTLTGSGGITINKDEKFDYGIHLVAGWSDACLMIDENVGYDIGGSHSVFRVTSTCSEKPMWEISPQTWKNSYQAKLVDENFSFSKQDPNHYYSWILVGGGRHSTIVHLSNGYHLGGDTSPTETAVSASEEEPETVIRMPIGGDSAFPILSNPLPDSVGLDGQVHASGIVVFENFDNGTLSNGLVIYDNQQHHPTGRDDISYDPATNTLTLNNYHGGRINLSNMGNSFKVRLIGKNELVDGMLVNGDLTSGSITFTGDGYLSLNSSGASTFGLIMDGGEAPACLMIDRDVVMDIYGSPAINIGNTSTDKAIYYLSDGTLPGVLQQGRPGGKGTTLGTTIHNWRSVDAQGDSASHIHFGGEVPDDPELPGEPIGGDSSYPNLPNLQPGGTSPDGVVREPQILIKDGTGINDYRTFYLRDQGVGPLNTNSISYDAASNTLTLNNYRGYGLELSNMGNSFTVRLIGKNVLEETLHIQGDYLGSSIRFTGDGYLSLGGPDSFAGLWVRGIYSETCVMIDSSVTLDLYGGNFAFWIDSTSAPKGIYYQSSEVIRDARQWIRDTEEDSSGTVSGSYNNWVSVDRNGHAITHIHFGGEVPKDTEPKPELWGLPVGGDSAFPDLPNPNPNTPVPGYGVINEDYVLVTDRDADTYGFIYFNSYYNEMTVSRDGIFYDPATNTLTLNNYQGKGISANLLGNGLTVELIGESELTQGFEVWGFYTGGSIHFTGNGSLTINSSKEQIIGLQLYAEFSTSCVMIDKSVTLDIYGESNAVEVRDTNAEQAIYLLSDSPIEGVRQYVVSEELPDNEAIEQVPYQFWHLVDNDGFPVKHLHVEGSNSILDWFGR